MNINIDKDEWYPVYFIDDSSRFGRKLNVDKRTVIRWKKVFEAFQQVQNVMKKLCDSEEGKEKH